MSLRNLLPLWIAAAGLALATAVAGCGATRAPAGGGARSSASGDALRVSAGSALPLTGRLLRASDFRGYHLLQPPTVVRSPREWETTVGTATFPLRTGAFPLHQAARLTRLGFIAATYETLAAEQRSSAEVTSSVEQFSSGAAARQELAQFHALSSAGTARSGLRLGSFPVGGLPRALGVRAQGPFSSKEIVAFVKGPFYYQVGVVVPRGGGTAPSRETLIKACSSLYRRV